MQISSFKNHGKSSFQNCSLIALICCLFSFPIPDLRAQPFDAAWISAASGSWTDVFRWNTFGFLPFPDNDSQDEFNVLIALDASPTIQLNTDIEVVNLELAAGFVQGDATLTAEDQFLWRGGGFTGGNGQLTAPQKVTMTSGNKTLRGFNIINAREAEWSSGDVRSGTEGIFHNLENAVFKTDFDGSWLSDDSRPHGQFRNLGTFYKQESTGTTLIACEYFNAGKSYLLTGSLKFAGPVVNESLFEASEDTILEFAHAFESTHNTSITSLNDVHFSSPSFPAIIRGIYSVKNSTTLSGKETIFHPETDLVDIGQTLLIQKGKAHFNSEETVTPQDLLLTEKGQILGSDPIEVQNYFLWGNGTSIGGEGTFHNIRMTEMARVDETSEPRVFGNRSFVNSGQLIWSAGDLIAFENASIINDIDAVFSIQGNVRSTAFMPKAYPQILNDGLIEITDMADNVDLEWKIKSNGLIKLSAGRVAIRGGLKLTSGQLVSSGSTLITPNLEVQKAAFDGKLSIKGNMQCLGRLDLLSDDKELFGEYFNAGQSYLLTGKMKFAGPVTNESLIEASEDTVLEFAHALDCTQNASITSLNEVHFSSPLHLAEIRGRYSVKENTILSGKESVFHPETDLVDIGQTLSIQKGKAHFNTGETVTPQDLLLTEKGQILGSDPIEVQNYFLWGNGTSIGGEGTFHNIQRTEMARIDQTTEPRVLGNRLFVNSGEIIWSAGNLITFEKAVVVNKIDSVFTIQGNVRSTAFMPKAYPQILNDGLLEITDAGDNVILDWNVESSGTVKLPKGRVTIRGGLKLNDGQLLSDSSTLSTPNLKVHKAVLDGQLSINGNLQSFGRLDLLSSDTSLYVSGTVELDPSNQLHVAVSQSVEGTTKPSIYAGNTLVAQGALVVHFHEDWKPQHGETIPVLESNLLLGEFRNVFPLRVNESYSVYPVYDSNKMSLLVFEDGNEERPQLNIFDIGDEIFLSWPRALSEHRLQFKSRFEDDEWSTYRRTFVNFTTFPKEEPLMLFRLIAP